MKKQKMRKIVCFILTFVVLLSGMPKLQVNADSTPANVLYEGFEGTTSGIYDLDGWVTVLGSPTQTDTNPRSGSYSYQTDTKDDMIRYDFSEAQQGVVTLYMYDSLNENKAGTSVFVDVAAYNPSGNPINMAMGVVGKSISRSETNDYYAVAIQGASKTNFKATEVERTKGWHKLTWDYSDSGYKMYIDDILVSSGSTMTSFINIRLGARWSTYADTNFCFDDITVEKYVASVTVGESTVATSYSTLQEAIAAATEGAEITLLENIVYENALEIGEKVTLDLNGKTLTASSVATFGGNVVDDSDDKTGLLKVDSTKCAFSPTNSQMPVYNGEGYVFATITPQEKFSSEGENESTVYNLIFRPYFGSETTIQNAFTVNGTDDQFNVILRLTWTEDTEQKTQDLVYNDAMVQQVYDNNKAFYINASGVASFEGLTITPMVVSKDNGVAWSGTSFPEVTITE